MTQSFRLITGSAVLILSACFIQANAYNAENYGDALHEKSPGLVQYGEGNTNGKGGKHGNSQSSDSASGNNSEREAPPPAKRSRIRDTGYGDKDSGYGSEDRDPRRPTTPSSIDSFDDGDDGYVTFTYVLGKDDEALEASIAILLEHVNPDVAEEFSQLIKQCKEVSQIQDDDETDGARAVDSTDGSKLFNYKKRKSILSSSPMEQLFSPEPLLLISTSPPLSTAEFDLKVETKKVELRLEKQHRLPLGQEQASLTTQEEGEGAHLTKEEEEKKKKKAYLQGMYHDKDEEAIEQVVEQSSALQDEILEAIKKIRLNAEKRKAREQTDSPLPVLMSKEFEENETSLRSIRQEVTQTDGNEEGGIEASTTTQEKQADEGHYTAVNLFQVVTSTFVRTVFSEIFRPNISRKARFH